jgi:hypothetical protein
VLVVAGAVRGGGEVGEGAAADEEGAFGVEGVGYGGRGGAAEGGGEGRGGG